MWARGCYCKREIFSHSSYWQQERELRTILKFCLSSWENIGIVIFIPCFMLHKRDGNNWLKHSTKEIENVSKNDTWCGWCTARKENIQKDTPRKITTISDLWRGETAMLIIMPVKLLTHTRVLSKKKDSLPFQPRKWWLTRDFLFQTLFPGFFPSWRNGGFS